jgi:DNA-binding HxlR family transcriptional regulator
MARSRRYKLLCPIARALDRIGDRWTLLILRDLQAGPARFSDLQTGLVGIAPNLLTDRMQKLMDDGLVEKKKGEFGVVLYVLTDLGGKTNDILFELAMFGGRFEPDEEPQHPGNLRTIVVSLRTACQRVVTPDLSFEAQLVVDGETFVLSVNEGHVGMWAGTANTPDVVLITSYEPMIAAAEGEMPMNQFLQDHVTMTANTKGKELELMTLMGTAMTSFSEES